MNHMPANFFRLGPTSRRRNLKSAENRTISDPDYIFSPSWRAWVYPAASVIDTDLPKPPEFFHINLFQKPEWVPVPEGPRHVHFDAVPAESIGDWHKRHRTYQA